MHSMWLLCNSMPSPQAAYWEYLCQLSSTAVWTVGKWCKIGPQCEQVIKNFSKHLICFQFWAHTPNPTPETTDLSHWWHRAKHCTERYLEVIGELMAGALNPTEPIKIGEKEYCPARWHPLFHNCGLLLFAACSVCVTEMRVQLRFLKPRVQQCQSVQLREYETTHSFSYDS